jgi:hypothetical protein
MQCFTKKSLKERISNRIADMIEPVAMYNKENEIISSMFIKDAP